MKVRLLPNKQKDAKLAVQLQSGLRQLSVVNRTPGTSVQPIPGAGPRAAVQLKLSGPLQTTKILNSRRLWHQKLPVLACNGCQFASQCPQFRAGYECAFAPLNREIKIQSEEDVLAYARELASLSLKRAQQMMIGEQLSGAMPSPEHTEAMTNIFNQLMALYDRMATRAEITVENEDGSIIGRLFGGADGLLASTEQTLAIPLEVPDEHGDPAGVSEAQRNLAAGMVAQAEGIQ